MRIIIVRMLATSSLAAFSASVTQTTVERPEGIHVARTSAEAGMATDSQASSPPKASPTLPDSTPERILPRGSRLDLSV